MPEYLAPGVYVEEVDTGSKPIEGVSTSTAGMIGVTERGPLNVPLLVTSYGEYTRWFGERLNALIFRNANGPHCFLPHAVEGFFLNGGKRLFITRVLDDAGAANAVFDLHDRGAPGGADTIIIRSAARNTGTVANLPLLVVLPDANLANNDTIRVGDGSSAEYRQVAAAPVVDTVAVALSLPLGNAHADPAGIVAGQFTPAAALESFQLVVALPATRLGRGEQSIEITGAQADLDALVAAVDPRLLEIIDTGLTNRREHRILRRVTRLSATNAILGLDSPLALSYANTSVVNHLTLPAAPAITANLDPDARAGDSLFFVDNRGTDFDVRTDMVVLQQAGNEEVRRIGELRQVTLAVPLAQPYPAGSVVEAVALGDDNHITIAAAALGDGTAANPLSLTTAADAAELSPGLTLLLGTGVTQELAVIQSVNGVANEIVLRAPLISGKGAGDPVVAIRLLTANARAGAGSVVLNNRQALAVGDLLRIGAPNSEEYVTITQLPNRATAGPDAGTIIFTPPLTRAFAQGTTQAVRQNPVVLTDISPSALVLEAPAAAATLLVSDGGGGTGSYPANSFISLANAGAVTYHRVSAISAAAIVPQMVTIDTPLLQNHRPGAPLIERQPMVTVIALDPGAWGNRLRISVSDENPGLVNNTSLTQFGPPTLIRLASAAGVEAGSILEFVDAAGVVQGTPAKVDAINLATGDITLAGPGLLPPQQVIGIAVRSREFSLTVRLLRQPDPALPSRNDTVIDLEGFRNLSLDPRHSRYIHKVIGTTWTPGNPNDDDGNPLRRADRRSEGESYYVRVRDLAPSQLVRIGPEALWDRLPNGQLRAARHPLAGGDDAIPTLTDVQYIGVDAPNPEDRTGLHTLRNYEEISIIAAPGRTGQTLQGEMISHCELMRYRFAVLDGPVPPGDALIDVQTQRQNFDTKYAAIYYPWVLIPDPFPTNLNKVAEYPVPPAGHMLGIYARTDIERGVHKAPANEVVRGVIGLRRVINKEQHDLLNPYPVNINVIRDFRTNNRGIRVYGGRVITSDSDWKYVNVRRLLIFIEASLDRGLQWVVFEPNAEPLWARVRRTISDFLTLIWRNGALEGTKPEEAYYVKCDRTTMTQLDIDSGRLICLIGVAPVKPAEFVIIRIGLWTRTSDQ